MSGNLFVGGVINQILGSNSTQVTQNSSLLITGDVSMGGNIYAAGLFYAASDVSMASRLFINGDVSMNSRLFINSDVSMGARLFINNDVSMNGNVYIGGSSGLTIDNSISMNNGTINQTLSSAFGSNPGYGPATNDLTLTNRLFVAGDIYTNASVIANGVTLTSDYRIKDVIRTLDSTYTIDDLRPVHYRNKITQKEEIGLIAHELQEKYSFLVTGSKDGDEYQTVNYNGLFGILIHEIQQLKKELSELKSKNNLI
jgi:hypothetical protein